MALHRALMSYLFMAASPRGRGSDVLASKPTPSGMMYDHHYQKISLQPTRDLAPLRVILSMKNKLRSPPHITKKKMLAWRWWYVICDNAPQRKADKNPPEKSSSYRMLKFTCTRCQAEANIQERLSTLISTFEQLVYLHNKDSHGMESSDCAVYYGSWFP